MILLLDMNLSPVWVPLLVLRCDGLSGVADGDGEARQEAQSHPVRGGHRVC